MYDFFKNRFTKLTNFFWWKNTQELPGIPKDFHQKNKPLVNLANYEVVTDLKQMYNDINQIKDFYLTQTILNRIVEDALNPFGDNEIFKVKIRDLEGNIIENATDEIKFFLNEFNINNLILSNVKDILLYGNVVFKLNYNEKNNLIEIDDNIDFTNIIPNLKNGKIISYYRYDEETGEIVNEPFFNYVYFGYNFSKKRVKINGNKIYTFKISEGILNPVLDNLKTLYMLEKLVNINLLKVTSEQKIYSLTVPEGMNPEEVKKALINYERLLNENINGVEFDFSNISKTLEKILENTNTIKVIPSWGDKGALEKQEYNIKETFDYIFEKVNDLRVVTIKTIGFTENFLDNDVTRSDFTQNSIRYTRKLKMIQKSLEEGIKDLCYIYLINKGYKIFRNYIEVKFSNTINLSDLEELEYMNSILDLTNNIKDTLNEIKDFGESEENIEVDTKKIVSIMNNLYSRAFKEDLIKFKDTKNNSKNESEDEDEI